MFVGFCFVISPCDAFCMLHFSQFVSEKVHGNYALLLTTRQLCSLLGSVLYGKAVESWGFRLPFATTAVATLLMCTLVSLSSSAEVLLLSHLLTILLQTYTGALMFITEVTNKTGNSRPTEWLNCCVCIYFATCMIEIL